MMYVSLTVEELNGYVHSIFVAEEMLHGVSVFGEVSGFKISGAHAYFTIKGKDAAILVPVWRQAFCGVSQDVEAQHFPPAV